MNIYTFFKGRMDRLTYLLGSIAVSAIIAVSIAIISVLLSLFDSPAIHLYTRAIILAILYLVQIVFIVSFTIRRLHDLNKRGWWTLLLIIPFVNIGLAIYLMFWRGDVDTNQYGARPDRDRNLLDAILNRDYEEHEDVAKVVQENNEME